MHLSIVIHCKNYSLIIAFFINRICFLSSNLILFNSEYSIDYKLSSNIYNNETFRIKPEKFQFKNNFNFIFELEYLTMTQIEENIQLQQVILI